MNELKGEKDFDIYINKTDSNDYPEYCVKYKQILFDYLDILKDMGESRQDKIKKCKEYLAKNYSSAMKSIDKGIALQIDPNLKDLKEKIILKIKEENIRVYSEKAL
jgi:hypothetical protein